MNRIQKSAAANQNLDKKKMLLYILSFCFTVMIILLLFWKKAYYPFGNNSLATMDANIQYLDFFAYLKDVLSGKNSVFYTMGKTLGGTNIAVFSYYLSSPFNILLLFFNKDNIILFFNCIVMLKLGTTASAMAYFLDQRFSGRLNACFILLLSVSYALMQYNIAQSSNIMWLDGVYMLPLMLLGIYKLVSASKTHLLIFSTALSIIFNWYSAGINCLFTAVWFCLEWLLAMPEQIVNSKMFLSKTLKMTGCYIISMLTGVLLSAFLFIPTLASLSAGGRGHIDWNVIKNTFNANIMNIVQGFTLGATSSNGRVSLYCGSLALLGCIAFFVSKNIDVVKKLKIGIIFSGALMIFYWQPFFVLFSLLKSANSYWYRYSYVTIFLIIFIAAEFYSEIKIATRRKLIEFFLKISVAYSIVLLTFSYLHSVWDLKKIYYSCIFMIAIAVLTALYYIALKNNKWRSIAVLFLVSVMAIELSYNTKLLMNTYHRNNASKYQTYSLHQQKQISEIQNYDSNLYRISQTTTYNFSNMHLTANYNEALAYNYWSISGYTSDPDSIQCTFLNKLGYRSNGENMCIVNTSILPADSLLGVKYILSDTYINGLKDSDFLEDYNGKKIYYNPYALPMAFLYKNSNYSSLANAEYSGNPFEYQNKLYSKLLGEDVKLYRPLKFKVRDDVHSKNTRVYTITLLKGNYAVYGNIPWKSYMDATLNVNDSYEQAYSRWLSPSVFYVPVGNKDSKATITLEYKKNTITEEQFYALDLEQLATITKKISQKVPKAIFIENGYAKFNVYGNDGDHLYTSIPYNKGWVITLNGREIEPELFENCMISIPLEIGENSIVMKYNAPYLKFGVAITLFTLIGIALNEFMKRRKHQCD